MWTKELFGIDLYHSLGAFVIYSMIGWLLESIYMSFCNRKLTNRGFAKGPFCPIYGFGAVACYLILGSFRGQYVKVYIAGAVLATIFEYIVGMGMIKFLGELWWDYNDKPFNYKGIICLESTIAWGFYALGVVHFVHDAIMKLVDSIDYVWGTRLIMVILFLVAVDYMIQLANVFHIDVRERGSRLMDRCQAFFRS